MCRFVSTDTHTPTSVLVESMELLICLVTKVNLWGLYTERIIVIIAEDGRYSET